MERNIITLTKEQLNEVKSQWSKEYAGQYEDGCLCGYYECHIDNVGYLVVSTYCRKSSGCPVGMNWFVEEDIQVWNEGLDMWRYAPESDELEDDSLQLLGYIDEIGAKEIRDVVRKSIIRDYSYRGTDEYGNDPDDSLEEDSIEGDVDFKEAYYTLLEYVKNLKATCDNCASDKSGCGSCKNGQIQWSLNCDCIPVLEEIE